MKHSQGSCQREQQMQKTQSGKAVSKSHCTDKITTKDQIAQFNFPYNSLHAHALIHTHTEHLHRVIQ